MAYVELHVHLEGAIQPDTLLLLARRNQVDLPTTTADGLRAWYTFRDFAQFVGVYLTISSCLCTPDDIELVARAFLAQQATQHIVYSEVTYTAFTHYHFRHIPFREQLAALNRARRWAEAELGTTMRYILDIPRAISPEDGLLVANWAIEGMSEGVVALGLAGPELAFPAARFREAFARARAAGLACVPHAGEMAGPESIREVLSLCPVARIGHGVRCLEDAALVAELRERQIPLEVCPTSNVHLGVVPSLKAHPLPQMLDAGLCVTLNTDDPALFQTTLADEYRSVAQAFGLDAAQMAQLAENARAAVLDPDGLRQVGSFRQSPTPGVVPQ